MKLIKPSFQIIEPTGYTIDDIYKSIELVGRVSHKSEDRITEDSAKTFVERMIKMKHLSTCEFGTIYLKIPAGKYQFLDNDYFDECDDIKDSFFSNPYTRIHCQEGYYYISTNYRVLVENFSKEFISELLQYLCEPTEYHERRITVKFICDRAIANEFVRHRKFSFLQESTRYCNYSKDRFGNELTFIIPEWLDIEEGHHKYDCSFVDQKWMGPDNTEVSYQWLDTNGLVWYPDTDEHLFLKSLSDSEEIYFKLLEQGWKPQQARTVLPNALKTELVMAGFVSDWEHFFSLRVLGTTGAPHPQAKELAEPLMKEFERRSLLCTIQ